MKVKEIMSKYVKSVEESTPISEVAQIMWEGGYTGVPVVKDGEVVGIITEDEIIWQKGRIHTPEFVNVLDSYFYIEDPAEIEDNIKRILGTKASDVMTEEVLSILPEADIKDLVDLFEESGVNPVPVVNDKGNLEGVVSKADIVKILVK